MATSATALKQQPAWLRTASVAAYAFRSAHVLVAAAVWLQQGVEAAVSPSPTSPNPTTPPTRRATHANRSFLVFGLEVNLLGPTAIDLANRTGVLEADLVRCSWLPGGCWT